MSESIDLDLSVMDEIKVPEISIEAIISYSKHRDEPFILEWKGIDNGLFDNGLHYEDIGLIFPDDLVSGLCECNNFRTTNLSYDRESGWVGIMM